MSILTTNDGTTIFYYPGTPHGLAATHQDVFNRDLLAFIREDQK